MAIKGAICNVKDWLKCRVYYLQGTKELKFDHTRWI